MKSKNLYYVLAIFSILVVIVGCGPKGEVVKVPPGGPAPAQGVPAGPVVPAVPGGGGLFGIFPPTETPVPTATPRPLKPNLTPPANPPTPPVMAANLPTPEAQDPQTCTVQSFQWTQVNGQPVLARQDNFVFSEVVVWRQLNERFASLEAGIYMLPNDDEARQIRVGATRGQEFMQELSPGRWGLTLSDKYVRVRMHLFRVGELWGEVKATCDWLISLSTVRAVVTLPPTLMGQTAATPDALSCLKIWDFVPVIGGKEIFCWKGSRPQQNIMSNLVLPSATPTLLPTSTQQPASTSVPAPTSTSQHVGNPTDRGGMAPEGTIQVPKLRPTLTPTGR